MKGRTGLTRKKGLVSTMEDMSRNYNQEFKTVSNRSMIRFIFNDSDKLAGYQLEMLKHNQIPSLLKSEVLYVDQEIRISFDITSLMPINKILERKEIGRREFFDYLSQITGVFEHLENYLLDYDGIVLDSSMIYGSPSDNRIYFIYIPHANMEQNINESLRQFMMNLIIREMKFINEHTDNYIQQMIEALKAPDFTLQTLKSYLAHFSQDGNKGIPGSPSIQALNMPSVPLHSEEYIAVAAMTPAQQSKPAKASPSCKTVFERKRVYPLKSWLVLGSAVLAIMVLFIVMVLKGTFEPDSPDTLTSMVGLVLISGAVIWLVCSKVFTEDKSVEKTVEKKIPIPDKMADVQTMSAVVGSEPQKKVAYVNKAIPQPTFNHELDGSVQNLTKTKSDTDRTVLLAEKGHTVPSIKRLGGDGETIMIQQCPFRLGRMAEQVDYCVMNPAVGKIHAELTKGPEGYCIADMNTRNGTFINGNRIEPNMEQLLKSGDRVMLANEEFLFSE